MHDYVAGTDRARQRHQVADFGDILPPCRPPRVHLALSTKFQNLQFPPALSYLVSIPTEVGISFLLKFNRYMSFLSAKMSLLFLRTIISKLRRKIYDTSIKDALRSKHDSFRVFERRIDRRNKYGNNHNGRIDTWKSERERGEVETSKIHGSSARNDCDVYAAHRNGARGT